MLKRPQALLLDAGNTVVFLDHEALVQIAAGAGLAVRSDQVARAEVEAKRRYERSLTAGTSHEEGWELYMRTLFEMLGLPEAQARRATVTARAQHDAFNLWRKVPSDLPAALTRARRAGLRLGIVSNSEGKLDALLVELALRPLFDVVVDSGVEGVSKPDPEIFERALSRIGTAAADALYAGDIPQIDVDGARAAGLDAVLIDTLDHYPDYRDAPRFTSVSALVHALGL